ncbi:MAG: RluA family pseudouridine synthase [Myxococcota bacterium]
MTAKSTVVEFAGDSPETGLRLDRALADRLGVSRARVRHLLEVGRVAKADRVLSLSDKSLPTEADDRFTISGSLRAEEEEPRARPDLDLTVAAEGIGWLVVDKPAGWGVHPLRADQEDTVLNAVVARYEQIVGVGEGGFRSGVVHRLDVDTTGALLFAKDDLHWKRFRGAFSEHRVFKTYRALVVGNLQKARRMDFSLAVTRHHPAHVGVVADGRPCRQYMSPVQHFANATLVDIQLETGFLHQIRATMAHLGHPIVGDLEYASKSDQAKAPAPRQMLHAMRLAVDEISVEVPLPADMQAVLDELA